MRATDIIEKKRDGYPLSKDEISFMINGYTKNLIPDYQMSAFLMAVFFKGMTDEEATHLALLMRDSGDVVNLDSIKGIKVDKHSTGGVGDKVTLVLAPLVSYLGAKVAKMSGRGLGHTGGTLDKLESIPGYKIEIGLNEFKEQVNKIGLAVIGQTGDVAPADKKIYALRDVTATVDSIPLIAASIMSKKLASGSDAICLDVKFGNGAFMKTVEDATKLATLMVNIGNLSGKKMRAVLTNMNEPLGHKIGNGLEVYEAIETLKGKGPEDLNIVTSVISGHLLTLAGITKTYEEGYDISLKTLKDGKALPKLIEMVEAQGGDISYVKDPEKLIEGTKKVEIKATNSGYIESIDALAIGHAAMILGAGRATKEDSVDLKVGLDLRLKIGDKVNVGDTIAIIYHHDKGVVEASKILEKAISIGNKKVAFKLIEKVI
ncbi:thymidine phosphorylase [Alteracholeplasma palmae J233]|uniref:Thymidine phosphorylase n=1 Tax=Alteracholeplasma palmae (strain ATCC 49389 / J233) TaxID=1318466 RepID=U4KRV0_ALTPJ|nr:pyrimidine-nucleoside phosphorylase [Alteracholeplasma palmae]CCV64461.1 thymidine phosphorylase [Alteracholeplasma palmae J233]